MKQSLYALGIMLAICPIASAQKSETAFLTPGSIATSSFYSKDKVAKEKTYSLVAEENFRKDFKDATNIQWTAKENGYRVFFVQHNITTAVDYNKKGNVYSIIRYGRKLLTNELSKLISDSFAGAEIREVSEVKIASYSSKAYVIVLEDKTSLKTIQVIDGDISVLHEQEK
jgi:hypothetical protein